MIYHILLKGIMKERDFYLDNIKFILIFLVVLGHYSGCYLNSRIMLGFYDTIYSFHMPAFILLSGYLSKNIKQQRYKDIDSILLPYIIIQLIYILYRKFLGMPHEWSFAVPIDANWYLLGLFIWRLIIPYFNYIKFPVITALVLSLSIGFFNDFGSYLDLERILTFFPYFVVGYFLPTDYTQFILPYRKKLWPYILFAGIVAFFFIVAYMFPGKASFIKKSFIPQTGYEIQYGRYADVGLFIRSITYVSSLFIAYVFFIIAPVKRTWFSQLGTRTINVFLFHLIFLYLVGKYVTYHPFYTELIAIPLSAAITLFLSSKFMAPLFESILNFHNQVFNQISKIILYLKKWKHFKSGLRQV